MNKFLVALTVAAALAAFGQRTEAQSLTFALFERYLESLREQAAIPGMSAVVLQGRAIVWEKGFGRADLEGLVPADGDTPYLIGDLSQTFGATLLLKECIDERAGGLNDPVVDWDPGFGEPFTRIGELLAHVVPGTGAFRYDAGRFAALTSVIAACSGMPYPQLLAEEIFSRLGLLDSVPGTALAAPTEDDLRMFGVHNLQRYAAVLSRLAKPYRVDFRGRHVRTEVPPGRADAATGVVTTARNFARFDATLDDDANDLLRLSTREHAWTSAGPNLPVGLGWFVQQYNGQRIVWQFGHVKDAYSALVVKVPDRKLTFILLANSDTLAAPFVRETWDVTASVFARLFLVFYVP